MKAHKRFLEVKRKNLGCRPICERVKDFKPITHLKDMAQAQEQASRCMDCGTPFCHNGCPLGNYIPEWNAELFQKHYKYAFTLLDATNNLPEITGRICPAPCEYSCVLSINDDAITIRENELAIIEEAFKNKTIKPIISKQHTSKKVAVVGSGPAGLSAAAQLNRAGHNVTVFERDSKIGGLLRYGIPDFKLDKTIIDRRVKLWEKEGITFTTNTNVGVSYKIQNLLKQFDAICLTIGARVPRDLKIEGRNLSGIYFAMDFLTQANKKYSGEKIDEKIITAKDKRVVVIGGGDTGADCIGIAHRQGAKCVIQIEVMPKPADCRTDDYPWPKYPLLLKTSSSHEEGGKRQWSVLTKKFIGDTNVKKIQCIEVAFSKDKNGVCPIMKEISGSNFEIEADLVLLAIGFIHPEQSALIQELGVKLDPQGNIKTNDNFMTSINKVFAAGDAHRGQSLVVWAIAEGRRAAYAIDTYLMGKSYLPII